MRSQRNAAGLALAGCVAVAIALRWSGLWIDPWLDEVWSWGLARGLRSWTDVFEPRTSNNHVLVTLWMRLVGDQAGFALHRLPSFVAGVASVVLAWRIARNDGAWAAACAALLVASDFLLVVFSTEARGYALLVVAALALFLASRAWLERHSRGALAAAWAACALGWLAQPLFAQALAAIGAWCLARVMARRTRVVDAQLLVVPPLLMLAALYFVHLRHVENSGAPSWSALDVARGTLAFGLGLPVGPLALAIGVPLLVVTLALDARALVRDRRDEWIAFVVAVALVPLATAWLLRREYLAERYFVVPVAFASISIGRVAGRAITAGGIGRVAAAALFVALLAGHGVHIARFQRAGKGQYSRFVADMAERTASPIVTVSGAPEFEVSGMLEYFRRFLPAGKSLRWFPRQSLPKDGVAWIVLDSPPALFAPEPELTIGPLRYELVDSFVSYGPCGAGWALYQRR